MNDYIRCEVRENTLKETSIKTIFLKTFPRIGEHIQIETKTKICAYKITDVWHFIKDDEKEHKIHIYVDSFNALDFTLEKIEKNW